MNGKRAPQHVIDALQASLQDIAAGNVHDASSVQAEAKRMLAEAERTLSRQPSSAVRTGKSALKTA